MKKRNERESIAWMVRDGSCVFNVQSQTAEK